MILCALQRVGCPAAGTDATAANLAQPLFLYLLQCANERDTSGTLEGTDSAVLQLVYTPLAGKPHRSSTFELLNTSWNEGRNALLARAREVYPRLPLYLIFMDCDARLEEVKNFGANTGHAYRTFEKYLTRHQPAVGHAHFDWQPYNKSKEVELLTGNFDAIVNAFRRDVLDVLLPYETLWDRHSWHYSQFVVHTLTSALFPTGRMQFNALRVKQRVGHSAYPRGAMWEVPFFWILPLLRCRQHMRHLPVFNLNLETKPLATTAALIRNVHPLLAVVYRRPPPATTPTPLSALPTAILARLAAPQAWARGVDVDNKTMEVAACRARRRRDHSQGGHSAFGGVLAPRGRGAWVRWGEGDGGGGGGGQGGGGGHAGVLPAKEWLREAPLLWAEKEALRAAYLGGAALQDWLCPPTTVSFALMSYVTLSFLLVAAQIGLYQSL